MAAELDTENLLKAQHHKDKKQARRVCCMSCTQVSPVPTVQQAAWTQGTQPQDHS